MDPVDGVLLPQFWRVRCPCDALFFKATGVVSGGVSSVLGPPGLRVVDGYPWIPLRSYDDTPWPSRPTGAPASTVGVDRSVGERPVHGPRQTDLGIPKLVEKIQDPKMCL